MRRESRANEGGRRPARRGHDGLPRYTIRDGLATMNPVCARLWTDRAGPPWARLVSSGEGPRFAASLERPRRPSAPATRRFSPGADSTSRSFLLTLLAAPSFAFFSALTALALRSRAAAAARLRALIARFGCSGSAASAGGSGFLRFFFGGLPLPCVLCPG